MKKITKALLVLFVLSMFSCNSNNEQQNKEGKKQKIEEDTTKTVEEIENEHPPIVKEDTIIHLPKINNDTTPVIGILTSIENSDFWGRVWLQLDINGKYKVYGYWGEPNNQFMGSSSFDHVRKLVGKKIAIKFKIEETLEEDDLHIDNKTIYGEYGVIKTDKQKAYSSKIEGILLIHGKSGDLPSTYQIVDDKGDTTTITAFIYDEHVALNGKRATVYYSHRTKHIAKSVVALEKKEINVDHYICYKNDKDTNQYIWVSFAKKEGALQVKYKGQKDAINLIFDREDYFCDGCAHPTIDNYYNEIYNEKVNGVYKLTHSGIWDYVEYTRGKDGKVFNYTIDHHKNPYGKSPCF